MNTLTAQDRFDIQEDIDRYQELLADVESADPDLIVNYRQWYATQEWLAEEIRNLEALL